jgi:hypothetical protein
MRRDGATHTGAVRWTATIVGATLTTTAATAMVGVVTAADDSDQIIVVEDTQRLP